MKKKILLIGRTGFVGSELYEFFKKNKISINYFSRKNISQSSKKLKKKNSLRNAIKQNNIIINCVGENTDLKKMNISNYLFVKEIITLIASCKEKKFLIHLSSCAVYGKYFHLKNFIINENTIPSPISTYARSKLKADYIIVKNEIRNLNYLIIRPSQVVGIKMKALGFIHLKKIIQKRLFFYVNSKNAIRNYVLSKDLCEFIFKVCKFYEFKESYKFKDKIVIVSTYSKLKYIVNYVEKKLSIKTIFNKSVCPKIIMIFVINILRIFFGPKKIPIKPENIEGLSATAKIRSNIPKKFNIKMNNIKKYLNQIL